MPWKVSRKFLGLVFETLWRGVAFTIVFVTSFVAIVLGGSAALEATSESGMFASWTRLPDLPEPADTIAYYSVDYLYIKSTAGRLYQGSADSPAWVEVSEPVHTEAVRGSFLASMAPPPPGVVREIQSGVTFPNMTSDKPQYREAALLQDGSVWELTAGYHPGARAVANLLGTVLVLMVLLASLRLAWMVARPR